MRDSTAGDVPDLSALVEHLDEENERLRLKVLDLLRLMEEAVDAQVASERVIADLQARVHELEVDLDSINRSFIVRATAVPRRALARFRGSSVA